MREGRPFTLEGTKDKTGSSSALGPPPGAQQRPPQPLVRSSGGGEGLPGTSFPLPTTQKVLRARPPSPNKKDKTEVDTTQTKERRTHSGGAHGPQPVSGFPAIHSLTQGQGRARPLGVGVKKYRALSLPAAPGRAGAGRPPSLLLFLVPCPSPSLGRSPQGQGRHPFSGLSAALPLPPGLPGLSLLFLRRLSIQPELGRAGKPASASELSRMFLPDMMSSPKPSWWAKA